jgi:lysozyme family protein
MSADNFGCSLSHVLASEGGYVHNPKDPGGATNCGVTQREYDAWRKRHGQPSRDVRLLDPNEREAIYREDYWNAVGGDDLPAGVDYCLFDFAVNSGGHEADICLQRAIQVLQSSAGVAVDGVIGPKTLAALRAADPRRIITEVCAERLSFMKEHCDWADFGRGWSNRVATVEQVARGMVS